jgi:Chalcone isomerase-like
MTSASLTIKDPGSGVEFPLVQKFWTGDEYRAVGAGCRVKSIAILKVKVYAVALYVEAEKAARELGIRDRGGFFERDDDYCSALSEGGFMKALQIQLIRDVEGATFAEALDEALRPRLSLGGELGVLKSFKEFFESKKLTKGTTITLLSKNDNALEIVLRSRPGEDYSSATPDVSIPSAGLCRALFEVYLGSNSVVPDAKREWAKGAKELLDSDRVRRDTRKGGSG